MIPVKTKIMFCKNWHSFKSLFKCVKSTEYYLNFKKIIIRRLFKEISAAQSMSILGEVMTLILLAQRTQTAQM